MKKIYDGIFVEEDEGMRRYVIEAAYSKHIKCVESYETATQKIHLRETAPEKEILHLIKDNSFEASLDSRHLIHVETEDPVRLVKLLCDTYLIDIEQATAIIAHEIEHIKNPVMQQKISGKNRLKEIREVIIQHKLTLSTEEAVDLKKLEKKPPVKGK